MKTLRLIICLTALTGLVVAGQLVAEKSGGQFTLRNSRGLYSWDYTAERILATPEWNIGTNAIPVGPDKACQIATDWLHKNKYDHFEFEGVHLTTTLAAGPKRFHYRIVCRDQDRFRSDLICVFVLMDGSLIEPKLTPNPEKTK